MTFKNWSFRLFIYTIILNVTVVFLYDPVQLFFIGLLATCILVLGTIFGFVSFVKKEKNDYKKYIGLIGNLILLLLGVAFTFLGYV